MNAGLVQHCPFCHKTVDPASRYAFRKVTGWERKAIAPNRRHGSDIIFRQYTDEWAHGGCVGLAKQGLLGQQSLLGNK